MICNKQDDELFLDPQKPLSAAQGVPPARPLNAMATTGDATTPLPTDAGAGEAPLGSQPDFSRNGVIGDIKNVTNRVTDYPNLWQSLHKI